MAEYRTNKAGILVREVVGYKGKKPVRISKTFPLKTSKSVMQGWALEVKFKGIPKYIPKNFDDLTVDWLKTKKQRVAKRTYDDYELYFRLYISGRLGKLDSITKDDLQDLLDSHSSYSPATIRKIKVVMSMVFDYAMSKDYLDKNPLTKDVSVPKQRRVKKIEVLNVNQFETLQKGLQDDLGLLTLLLTGLRISELLALEPKHVIGNTIRVEQSLESRYGKRIVSSPKTNNGYRTISIPEELSIKLRKIDDKFLFNLGYTGYQKRLKKYCAALGLPKMSLHGLRHSHCTYLMAQGVHVLAVSKRLGHHSPAFTLSRYGHLVPSMDEKVLEVLGGKL